MRKREEEKLGNVSHRLQALTLGRVATQLGAPAPEQGPVAFEAAIS